MAVERRRTWRTNLATQVRVRSRSAPPQTLLTCDVGPRGLFLRSMRPLDLNEPVDLELTLPGGDAPVSVVGRVAWAHRARLESGRAGMGIRFTRVPNDAAERLGRFFAPHRDLAGSRAFVVTDAPHQVRELARSLAREGLRPQIVPWEGPWPSGGAPVSVYVVVPSASGQSARLRPVRRGVRPRPGIVALLGRPEQFGEWLQIATVCLHGVPDPDRIAAIAMCVASVRTQPPGPLP